MPRNALRCPTPEDHANSVGGKPEKPPPSPWLFWFNSGEISKVSLIGGEIGYGIGGWAYRQRRVQRNLPPPASSREIGQPAFAPLAISSNFAFVDVGIILPWSSGCGIFVTVRLVMQSSVTTAMSQSTLV